MVLTHASVVSCCLCCVGLILGLTQPFTSQAFCQCVPALASLKSLAIS